MPVVVFPLMVMVPSMIMMPLMIIVVVIMVLVIMDMTAMIVGVPVAKGFSHAHSRFTTLAAAQAAPYPLSMFWTAMPGAQLTSMLCSAVSPPRATP